MAAYVALVLGYVLSQFYRSFLAVLAATLQAELTLTPGDLAYASGAWFAAFALMQFPIGYCLDRFGPRRTAAILLAIGGGGGSAMFALSQNAWQLTLAMALIGVGCAPMLMATFYLFARNFSAVRFATLGSTFIAIGTLGNIVGTEPLALAAEAFGWRNVSWGLCAASAAVGLAIQVFVRDPQPVAGEATGGGSYLALLRIPQLWPILPCILLGYAVAAGVRGLWAGPFLSDMYGLSTLEVGRVTLWMAIALSLGSLAYGPLDRLFNSRKQVVLVGNLLVAGVAGWLALATPTDVRVATALLVVIGFFGASYAVQMTHGKAFIPAAMMGRGVTLMNFFSIGGVGLMQFLSGALVARVGETSGPAAGYSALFGFYAVTLAAALFIYLYSTDARPSGAANSA